MTLKEQFNQQQFSNGYQLVNGVANGVTGFFGRCFQQRLRGR
jgi:hypothetical protein